MGLNNANHKKPHLCRDVMCFLLLILLRDYGELVALCKVIGWEIHIPNIPDGRKNGHPA